MRRRNFLLSILEQAKEKPELAVVDDQICSPTWARTIAEATVQILAKGWNPESGRLVDEASGLVTADVVTATPLDERRQDRLRRALSERTGREVKLEIKIDASLIAGATAKVGDLVFDGSIRTQLEQLRANLMKGS